MKATRCTVQNCEHGGKIRRGMCGMHYRRWVRHGTTEVLHSPSVMERFTSHLEERPNGCREWTGGFDDKGYGRISVNGKNVFTHRFAWMLANGPIPDGIFVCHHCDNPPCTQTEPTEGYPDGHLFLGTHDDNMADKVAKGRTRNGRETRTHCPDGHPYDAINTYLTTNGGRACWVCRRAHQARRSRAS